jgi:hypothetical protein
MPVRADAQSYMAVRADAETFGWHLWAAACRRGMTSTSELVVCQAGFAHFCHPFLGNHLGDGIGGNGLAERLDRQDTAELAFGLNFAYRKSHEVAPGADFRRWYAKVCHRSRLVAYLKSIGFSPYGL